ncbi:hypothetical protein ACFQ1S_07595 [Kibdelosporangium lantanae]|uniref:Uncharacterized protein n=1 Tax=Kibdelosporangium lantanae TaxID=1497396 RepID=A0ABW3M451_9PSEU
MIDFADPVGAATYARQHVRPDERLLWATHGRILNYDVRGLTPQGKPKPSVLSRVGEGVLDAVFDGDDSSDAHPDPHVVAFGRHVPQFLTGLPADYSFTRVWALTTQRLMVLQEVRATPPPEPDGGGSFLSKAVRFGKEVADIFTDRTKTYGRHKEAEPVQILDTTVRTEVHRSAITGFEVANLLDGTGVDFLLDGRQEPEMFTWMLALTNGTA